MEKKELTIQLAVLKGKLMVMNSPYITQEDFNLLDMLLKGIYTDFTDGSLKIDC